MKIEKLTDNKIRIIIDLDELPEEDFFDEKTLTQNTDKSYMLFQNILNEAEKQVGFKVQDCKLFVEAYFSSEGYVVFTLTKYKNNIKKISKKLKFKRKVAFDSFTNAIYKFDNFEEFCAFCTYCNNSKLADLSPFAKAISLYEYKNAYYLGFANINDDFKYSDLLYASISEFSKKVCNPDILKSKLNEYGKPIFKANAIKRGIKYFVNT